MKVRMFAKKVLLVVMTVVLVGLMPFSVYALSEEQLDKFAQNDIMFYDPDERSAKNFCSGNCYIVGNTKDEKLWSGLRHVGFTPEQAAGLMGNLVHEAGSPTRQEQVYIDARKNNCLTQEGKQYDIYLDATNGAHHGSCIDFYKAGDDVKGIGLGFVQWTSHSRRLGYLKVMEELGLLKYFEGDAYKTYGQVTDDGLKELIKAETGSEDDYWALWCAAIKYIYTEMTSVDAYKGFFDQNSVEDYAAFAAARYEVCASCQSGGSQYNARVESAKEYYQKYLNGDFDSVEKGSVPSDGSSSSQIQKTDSCSIPYNITSTEDALKIMKQYIIDTNALYGRNYAIPTDLNEPSVVNGEPELANPYTPNSDEDVTVVASVRDDWVSRGIITSSDMVSASCWGAYWCGQCTALSGWFVGMLTDYIYNAGDGQTVVSRLVARNPEIQVTDKPVPFSVFSNSEGSPGHTGIVIGDLGDDHYWLIDNNYRMNKLSLRVVTAEYLKSKNTTFAIVSDKLKLNHIGEE